MKKRILVLVSAMMMICSVAFAHVSSGGYLTEIGQVYIHDLRSGSTRNLIHIVGVKLSEKEALRWLADGGQFR